MGIVCIRFGPDQSRTLISMAANSSHMDIMGNNLVTTLTSSFLIGSSSILQVTRTIIKFRLGSKFGKIRPGTEELAATERLKHSHRLIMREML